MTNNDYQMLGMTQYMLREFRDRCNQVEHEAAETEEKIEYTHYADEALGYPIFNNHACSHQTAGELIANGAADAFRRWRFFFTPDPEQLPHSRQLLALNEKLALLKHSFHNHASPLKIILMLCGIVSALFMLRWEFGYASIPVLFAFLYWWRNQHNADAARQKLLKHLDETDALDTQKSILISQLASLPPPAEVDELRTRYQAAVELLLRDTLLDQLRPHELGDLANALNSHKWEGFITESWGHLQLPLKVQHDSEISQILLSEENIPLSALESDPQGGKGANLYRIQYLHIWILTEQGLLMGRAWYDRVMDHFLYEEHEFYLYSQLTHIRVTEQVLPEQATLKERLPERLHRRFFRQPLMTISVGTTLGKTYECALPPASERPLRQTGWLDHYGLDSDMTRLNRRLHERLYK
ncbi:MAG: hypothetical protein KJ914_08060 [Gammaproteobacteria bacterium]|nr:hypothetical protein [Gammaproteobacteria bacterium]MBU1723725.1 hypothetical protein [Gammaproteobacteria bacterium]MBU2004809.1 hypothetical protein [Gammaproteobacteria bacterium]